MPRRLAPPSGGRSVGKRGAFEKVLDLALFLRVTTRLFLVLGGFLLFLVLPLAVLLLVLVALLGRSLPLARLLGLAAALRAPFLVLAVFALVASAAMALVWLPLILLL